MLSVVVLSPVGMFMVCGRNVCLPWALILSLRHFSNNIRHLFKFHSRWIRTGDDNYGWKFSVNLLGKQARPVCLFTKCSIWNYFSSEKTKLGNWALSRKRSNSLALSRLTFFCQTVSSCTFWNFNGFSSSSFCNMCCIHCGVDFDQIWPSLLESFLLLLPFFTPTFWTRCSTAHIMVMSSGTRNTRFIHI